MKLGGCAFQMRRHRLAKFGRNSTTSILVCFACTLELATCDAFFAVRERLRDIEKNMFFQKRSVNKLAGGDIALAVFDSAIDAPCRMNITI